MRDKSVTCWGLRAVRSAREGSAASFSCINVRLSSTGTLVKRALTSNEIRLSSSSTRICDNLITRSALFWRW